MRTFNVIHTRQTTCGEERIRICMLKRNDSRRFRCFSDAGYRAVIIIKYGARHCDSSRFNSASRYYILRARRASGEPKTFRRRIIFIGGSCSKSRNVKIQKTNSRTYVGSRRTKIKQVNAYKIHRRNDSGERKCPKTEKLSATILLRRRSFDSVFGRNHSSMLRMATGG